MLSSSLNEPRPMLKMDLSHGERCMNEEFF